MEATEPVRQLAMDTHRVDKAGDADDPSVRRDQQDGRGKDRHVDLSATLERSEVYLLDDPQHRVAGEAAFIFGKPEQGLVGAVRLLGDRKGREGYRGQQRIYGEDGDNHTVDRLGHRDRLVLGLFGHVGDRFDTGVGDHPERDGQQELRPRRRNPELDVRHEHVGREDQHEAEDDEEELRREVDQGEGDVDAGRLLRPENVDCGKHRDYDDRGDDVGRRAAQRLPEDRTQVMRHEVGRDRDRDDVVEHLAPRGEERDELVECPPGEAR